ncbi:serine hydrolase [Streptacidiphilus cavernicola]|uniref:Serine hydrolase n=1 Tax=Streptacidiphilus cavernicola TaxID=3342716 RepID=A0ABV6W0T0_9ACTN
MSDQHRSLPDRPNLRYLKLEAKRRLTAGEFPSLHDAQLAVAREHGEPSWAALKRRVESSHAAPSGRAGEQLRWIASRFAGADEPGWAPPTDDELREHFHERFLGALPSDRLLPTLTALAPRLRKAPALVEDTPTHALVQLDGGQFQAVVEAVAPYRLIGLRAYGTGRGHDPRLAAPTTALGNGAVPAAAVDVAERAFSELGLVGLALAGSDGSAGSGAWALARGWAALDPDVELTVHHRFPVGPVSTLVTAVAVLCLVVDGRVVLDAPLNRQLRRPGPADPSATVRELLSGIGDAGAVLGRLIADASGVRYPEAVTRLVLEPLGMSSTSFARSSVETVTGYGPGVDGRLVPVQGQGQDQPTAAVGGLWTTAFDLVRFGVGWRTLLPEELAREALTPHTTLPGGSALGLGWRLDPTGEIAGLAGSLPGASASLVLRLRDRRVHVALSNRDVPVEPVNGRVLRALG